MSVTFFVDGTDNGEFNVANASAAKIFAAARILHTLEDWAGTLTSAQARGAAGTLEGMSPFFEEEQTVSRGGSGATIISAAYSAERIRSYATRLRALADIADAAGKDISFW